MLLSFHSEMACIGTQDKKLNLNMNEVQQLLELLCD